LSPTFFWRLSWFTGPPNGLISDFVLFSRRQGYLLLTGSGLPV
jgi:hypothetical protein